MEKIKELDKKILIGTLLTLGFLIIWLMTSTAGINNIKKASTGSFKITNSEENTEKVLQYNQDFENFNTAHILGNNLYCDQIRNSSLKSSCKKEVITSALIDLQEKAPDYPVADMENFNTGTITKNIMYCNRIENEYLKRECTKAVTGGQK